MQKKECLLSVIIPMYNCGDVIIRCLDSLDYPEAEIIVIDDGSRDDGALRVQAYAESHPNVRLLQKENGGVSSARNLGLDHAHGEYIMFVDADDYVSPDGISRVLHIAKNENADVLKYWANYVSADGQQESHSLANDSYWIRKIEGRAEALCYYDLSDYVIWDGLFKRSLIEQNNIRFNTSLHLHEDDLFMGTVYCFCTKVVEVNLRLYNYVLASAQSSTHNQNREKTIRLFDSSVTAIRLRKKIITEILPERKFPLERYKQMRYAFGCIWSMYQMKFSLSELQSYIHAFCDLGVYPLDYRWIKVARIQESKIRLLKYIVKTWLCNHPRITYWGINKRNIQLGR